MDDDIVAQNADRRVARDLAVLDVAARDGADGGDLIGLTDLGVADDGLAELGRKHTLHGVGDLVDGIINDAVHPHIDLVTLRGGLCQLVRADVEADDDGVGRGGQQNIGLVDRADARVDDAHAHLVVRQLFERGLYRLGRTLHVCLDDEVQLLHFALLQLGEEAFERDLLVELVGVVLDLLLTLLDQLTRHALVGNDAELVAGRRDLGKAGDLDRNGRACLLDLRALVVRHDTHAAHSRARNDKVGLTQRAVLDKQRCDRAAVLVQTRFKNATLARTVRVGLELFHLSGQNDRLKQFVDACARLGRDLTNLCFAAPFRRCQTVLGQLGQDAVGVCTVLIHLIDGHDDGDLSGLGVVDGLDGLRHDAVVSGDNENGDIGAHRAARTHLGKGRVARRVEEGDGLAIDFNGIRADVLRDAASLSGRDLRVADIVKQARLAVVDVAHDDHDRRTGDKLVCGVLMVVEQTLFDGDDDLVLDLAAKLGGDELRRVKVDGLVDRGHDAVFQQALDDLGHRLFHAGGQLADGDLVGDLDDQLRLLGNFKLEAAHFLLLLGAGLCAEALGLLLLFVLAADLLLAAGIILHAVGDERIDAVVIAVGIDRDGAGVDDAALALALRLRLLGGRLGSSLLRARLVLAALRLRRALAVLLRARLALTALRTRLVPGLRGLRGCGGLCLLCGRGSGRFLLLRSCGKDLLDRIDLVLLRDIVDDHVQLVFR